MVESNKRQVQARRDLYIEFYENREIVQKVNDLIEQEKATLQKGVKEHMDVLDGVVSWLRDIIE